MSNCFDRLTGIGNRIALQQCMTDLIEEAKAFAIVFIDIDSFAYFNDRYGHDQGDALLGQLAVLILQQLPAEAQLFRTGGDEFLVLLPNTPLADAITFGDRIRMAIAQHCCHFPMQRLEFAPDGRSKEIEFLPTVSCSVGLYPEHGQDWMSLMQAVDEAMYKHRTQFGRNQVAVVEG
ncbi:GGDEF domain-containing protein [Desertifilum sp. FACHB-1129]|uniref:GGDEF domain-containing protein n=1 Tax=Desertifilum tharense IPPAS B-1220 TaxID=1781255 RepID=A0A1E5QM49_9CYAN|nr:MULTISPECIES: GGDEF domain-containing protein [Desertifilum]MDA0210482.1 GGDEF domain-containing protein [Cyanobacteria bacterium FC1]MBD2311482.1 GGDEF domain-containing protein [Desertifilum sp. FACHB-1129]MBD2323056.1 GGDEF domain-containing protein [Desertifilum sp. FACHB-866]MBD2332901.1 GGDEF domain-containing protein [Desertifilum sp. FACHB-868]OEJ75759.1 hypothetical protein BH720_07440 [Desertifilum tharense IPPAS B-1220]